MGLVREIRAENETACWTIFVICFTSCRGPRTVRSNHSRRLSSETIRPDFLQTIKKISVHHRNEFFSTQPDF